MKFLTKDWASKYETARFISSLQETDSAIKIQDLESLSKQNFLKQLKQDEDMIELLKDADLSNKLFSEKLKRNAKIVDCIKKEVLQKLENVDVLYLGFACKNDLKILNVYLDELIKEIESLSLTARNNTENVVKYLSKPFDVEEIVGELVYDEYCKNNDYYIEIGGRLLIIKNYKFIERDDFTVNEWQEENPLTCWTCIKAVELHFNKEKRFEVHFLILNGDENENTKNLYFTLLGTEVTLI